MDAHRFIWDALGWYLSHQRANMLANKKRDKSKDTLTKDILCREVGAAFEEVKERIRENENGLIPQAVEAFKQPEPWKELLCSLTKRLAESEKGFRLEYHPAEHRFRGAAWAAATGARSSPVCRFRVSQGQDLLREGPLAFLALGPHWLPKKEDFDAQHEEWCNVLVGKKIKEGFSYGIAAKLINLYTKFLYIGHVLGGFSKPDGSSWDNGEHSDRIDALHPPIDRVLLKTLGDKNIGDKKKLWRAFQKKGWSKFDQDDYQSAIREIKKEVPHRPAQIEAFWQGYQ